jgi:hypothetical protein
MGDTALIGRKIIQDFGWKNALLREGEYIVVNDQQLRQRASGFY